MRNNNLTLMTQAEIKIYEAMQEVEKLGCDTRLTDAVILLQNAKSKVSEVIDERIRVDWDIQSKLSYNDLLQLAKKQIDE